MIRLLFSFIFFILIIRISFACDCPPIGKVSKEQFDLYEVIFEGRVDSVSQNCSWFEIITLNKGSSLQKVKLFFDDSTDCRMSFAKDEIWIIYSNYVKFSELAVNFCSRSRKKPRNGSADLFTVSNQNTYDEELTYLKQNLGVKPVKEEREQDGFPERELIRPKGWTVIWLFIASLLFFIVFYFISKRIFRK